MARIIKPRGRAPREKEGGGREGEKTRRKERERERIEEAVSAREQRKPAREEEALTL